jgi:hypothetical protein
MGAVAKLYKRRRGFLMGSVAKSYMMKDFLIVYMRKCANI